MKLNNYLIKIKDAVYAASVTYFMPIIALFWGVFDAEEFGWPHFVGMLTILVGVWLISRKKSLNQSSID